MFTYHQFACDESINPIKSQMVTAVRLTADVTDARGVAAPACRRPVGIVDAAAVTVAAATAAAAAAADGAIMGETDTCVFVFVCVSACAKPN